MSFTLRRVARVAVLATAASTLSLPLAAPADAIAFTERVWTLADSNDDGSYGLAYVDVPGTTRVPVEESASTDLSDLSASADGTRLVYVRYTAFKQQIVVRDMSTRQVRVVADKSLSDSLFVTTPVLSPDGTKVAWTEFSLTENGYSIKLQRSSVGEGPAAIATLAGYGALAYASNDVLLVQTAGGYNKSVPATGSTTTFMSGLPQDAGEVAVSPDGTKVTWSEDTTPGFSDISTARVSAGTLTNNGGTWTVASAHALSSTLDNEEPAFSRDGSTVRWVQYDGDAGLGEVLTRPYDASSAATTVASAADEIDVAVTAYPGSDSSSPGTVTVLPATLDGTTTTIRWTLPADSDLSGVVIYRKQDATIEKSVFVAAPDVAYDDTELDLGATYTYEIRAIDRANHYGPVATRQVTAAQALPTFADPTSRTSTSASFPVTFGPVAAEGVTFFVDYFPTGAATWIPWVTGDAARARTFGSAAATNVAQTTSTPGKSYTFRVQVKDAYGNASALTNSARAVVPWDQTKAEYDGGGNGYSSLYFLGGFRKLWHENEGALVTLTGNRLQVIGNTCGTCGRFMIFDGETVIGIVDTYGSVTRVRQVLFTKYYAGAGGTHTFTIFAEGTPDRPDVVLDGFAMRT